MFCGQFVALGNIQGYEREDKWVIKKKSIFAGNMFEGYK